MERHAARTSTFRSFFSVFGKLEPLHMTTEPFPSLIFRTKPPFGPTESSAWLLICAISASVVIRPQFSPVALARGVKEDTGSCGCRGAGLGSCTNGDAPAWAIALTHSSLVRGHSPLAKGDW